MKEYELTVLIHPDLEADLETPLKKVRDIITTAGGKIISEDNWGKKKLAYPINREDFAVYVYMDLELPAEAPLKISNTFNITDEDMYDIFGKYGAIRQIRIGQTRDTKGTAYVVYEDIYDAKAALEKLSGFNVANRYLIVLYFNLSKFAQKQLEKEEENLRRLQKKEGVSGEQTRE